MIRVFNIFCRQLKSWVAKKQIKVKQNARSAKKTKHPPKNSKTKNSKHLTVNSKLSTEYLRPLPDNSKSVPVSPRPPPLSLELIDPTVIFTPVKKNGNSNTLVSIFKINVIESY